MSNPYKKFPDQSFWTRTISLGSILGLGDVERPYLKKDDKVVSMGSCFAANMVPQLLSSGIKYVFSERIPLQLHPRVKNYNYESFSARYGNIYTTRQMLQLLQRSMGVFESIAEPWIENDKYIDPYRPGISFPAESLDEYRFVIQNHLVCVKNAIAEATVLVITLGLTEAWSDVETGAIFPACPGTIAGQFNPEKHQLIQLGVDEVFQDLIEIDNAIRSINPGIEILLSVSPVPLVATATHDHVLVANTYSKSVLRVAASNFVNAVGNARYIPAYEIITGPQAPDSYFESSRRDVSQQGINAVMAHFLGGLQFSETNSDPIEKFNILKVECEEEVQGHGR